MGIIDGEELEMDQVEKLGDWWITKTQTFLKAVLRVGHSIHYPQSISDKAVIHPWFIRIYIDMG